MTSAQRTKINRQNASRSCGPKTAEGKERSRQNAVKHGLCASELALPTENPDELQAQHQDWLDHYQPQGPIEIGLVKEIAKARIKLDRCERHETAVVSAQVRDARIRWFDDREDRLAAARARLDDDPENAVRELKRFGEGRRWLLGRWRKLAAVFMPQGTCAIPEYVDEATLLLGAHPKRTKTGPVEAYQFRLYHAAGRSQIDDKPMALLLSQTNWHPDHIAQHGALPPDPAQSREEVKKLVFGELEALEEAEQTFAHFEKLDHAEALERAEVPHASADASHALRYEAQARSALHRATKELERLQKERRQAEAGDTGGLSTSVFPSDGTLVNKPPVPPDGEQNEAKEGLESTVSDDAVTDCGEKRESGAGEGGCRVPGSEGARSFVAPSVPSAPVLNVRIVPTTTPPGGSA